MQTVADAAGLPDAAEELLCEAARRWLRRRGWEGASEWVRGDPEAAIAPHYAWTFTLGEPESASPNLRLRFPRDWQPAPGDLVLLQGYLYAAAQMGLDPPETVPPPGGAWVLARRKEIEKRLHDLNNRLNSLLANAGVLATAHREGDRLAPFARHVERDGEACAQEIAGLARMLLETTA